MEKNKIQIISAIAGFAVIVFIMAINIYFDQVGITGATVAEGSGNYMTAGIIIISLVIMGLIGLICSRLKK